MYIECIEELKKFLIRSEGKNLYAIVLYGGIVRDGFAIPGWSDIDVIVIFKSLKEQKLKLLSTTLKFLEKKFLIRLDISTISIDDITDPALRKNCYNSEIINALMLRENVSEVIYGCLPDFSISLSQEKKAALFYLNSIILKIRRYYLEVVFLGNGENFYIALPRLTRWVFSLIRTSLRLFNIFTHPYEFTIPHVKKIFPCISLDLLLLLISVRNGEKIILDDDFFYEIKTFVEDYYVLSLKRYEKLSDNHQQHKNLTLS